MTPASVIPDFNQGDLTWGFWRAQIAIWIVFALFGFVGRMAFFGNVEAAIWLTLCQEPLGFGLTSVAAVLYERRRSKANPPGLVVVCVVLLCMGASTLLASTGYAIHQLLVPSVIEAVPRHQFRLGVFHYMAVLPIWSLIYFGVSAVHSRMRAESRALRMELERLQQQIEPHFLFNSLNTIVAEIAERPATAEEMTRRLSDYLRYSLDKRGHGLCRLEEEIEAAETYVRIMAIRFDTRLECRCRVDPAALDKMLPHMTLQGLVENAIKHGMRARQESFVIDIDAHMQEDELLVLVSNVGQLRAPFDLARGGGGLGTLCRRLALRYPNRYQFALDQRGEKTVAQLRVSGEPEALLSATLG
ncbi:sensor histidine kinase [Candidimonas nitroreducens]|uniref:Sensor histidine kinase n=1 Tax=Candidimonas nitroreducens TaxID=683354 RepID=A0A225MM44_9BURK|nr:histidine kinase [Candidimonas nitroreducens]OWT62042.1 sensor histidine kinase [Candidimonas nitroreducens]